MANQYDIIAQLTHGALQDTHQTRILNDFAYSFGWWPSDQLHLYEVSDFSNAHLLVEHGLENTAVITFLKYPRHFSDLSYHEKESLLKVSYNNLVDWHIHVQNDEVNFVFNRTKPPLVETHRISRDNFDQLRSEAFEQVAGRKPNPNLPALDEAFIKTISLWRRTLSAEMGDIASTEVLSGLFNTIIFIRAVEDHSRRSRRLNGIVMESPKFHTLLDYWDLYSSHSSLREVILQRLRELFDTPIPTYLFDEQKLRIFDNLDRQTIYTLLSDFYRNKFAPYEYDFSLISKHALSRIYESYVSVLRPFESPQLSFFPSLPKEERDKTYGSVYTPQFIARFFARYLREQMPPLAYRRIRTADPACGSGIFLRTLLEFQCDPTQNGITTSNIDMTFQNTVGLDIDENACQATRLSLALLHLVLTDYLPPTLQVFSIESLQYYQEHPELKASCDVVITNPPFVSLDTQTSDMRELVSSFMGNYASGRIDMYLAFLRLGLEMLKPGGYGCFVLPHSFLLSKNASKIRKLISETSWIRCLADLSAIRVFGDVGSYIILLIFQKHSETDQNAPSAKIVKCHDLVGRALQDVLDGRIEETSFYSIYDTEQDIFGDNEWIVLPPTETSIRRKFHNLPVISDFLHVRQGFISGADDIFIVSSHQIPEGEERLFVPFLPDKEMRPYTVPDETSQYCFYPYIGKSRIDEQQLRTNFPKTWNYLLSQKGRLESRKSIKKGDMAWWEPERPRPPERLMRPKIVSPHLVLVPRFSLDREGKYAISHAPLLYPKEPVVEDDILRFFVAVLNSSACFWYITTHSHTYRRGYVMLEPKTLTKTPVPDPTKVSPVVMRHLLSLVDQRLLASGEASLSLERQLDDLIAELYGLSAPECRALGIRE